MSWKTISIYVAAALLLAGAMHFYERTAERRRAEFLDKTTAALRIKSIVPMHIAAQAPQPNEQIVAKAKSVALAKGENLAEYKQPTVSRLEDGTWVVHFEHVQRYVDNEPIYLPDDCLSVLVDGSTKEATFHPCP